VMSIAVVEGGSDGLGSCLLKWDEIEGDVWLLLTQVFRPRLWGVFHCVCLDGGLCWWMTIE
jgi:hypothetical protein